MNYANNLSVKYVVFVGEDEIKSEILTVKEMSSGNQSQMNILEFIKKIQIMSDFYSGKSNISISDIKSILIEEKKIVLHEQVRKKF